MKLTIRGCSAALFSLFIMVNARAQSAYSLHKLEPGETLSMIAKSYHTTVGDIMRMNGMNAQSQLHVGEEIKIPAGGVVVAAAPKTTAAPVPAVTAAPVAKTHTVAAGETLYRISQLYKIPVEQLKAINNLPDGNVKLGQTLLLTAGAAPESQPQKTRQETVSAAPRQEPVRTPAKETVSSAAPANQPVSSQTAAPVTQPRSSTAAQPASDLSQPVTKPPVAEDNSTAFASTYPVAGNAPKEGFFTFLYGQNETGKKEQVKNGSAMTFKSVSGWADKKYYILMNDAPTGSVVKIRSGRNELYAKVLWGLSEMKENEGLAFRISTATAAALGITDQKFDLKVNYYE